MNIQFPAARRPVLVHVTTRNGQPTAIRVDSGEIILQSVNDSVTWRFVGIPRGWSPAIAFQGGDQLGPFQSFDIGPSLVLGQGNTGVTGTFQYRAFVIKDITAGTAPVASDRVSLGNEVTTAKSQLQVEVTVKPQPDGGFCLSIEPEEISIYQRQTVNWLFNNIPRTMTDVQPIIEFVSKQTSSEPVATRAQPLGPFQNISTCRVSAGTDGPSFQVIGSSAADSQQPVRFTYNVALVSLKENSRVEAQNDPQIDTMGPPPG